jgi:hypothetical protein
MGCRFASAVYINFWPSDRTAIARLPGVWPESGIVKTPGTISLSSYTIEGLLFGEKGVFILAKTDNWDDNGSISNDQAKRLGNRTWV